MAFVRAVPVALVLLAAGVLRPDPALAWRQWGWDHVKLPGSNESIPGPVGRRGHTLNLVADDIVVLFGGRGPERLVKHTPRSMELEIIGGTVEIKSVKGVSLAALKRSVCRLQRLVTCAPNRSLC